MIQMKNTMLAKQDPIANEIPDYPEYFLRKLEMAKDVEEDSVTIIMPTMQRVNDGYYKFLFSQVNVNPYVKELLVIDNSEMQDFAVKYKPMCPKLKVYAPGKNIGVNAAWNAGISDCETKYYLLLNDDCMMTKDIIGRCCNVLNKDKSVGIVTVETINIDPNQYIGAVNQATIDIYEEYNYEYNKKALYGWFIFGLTENWVNIPSQFDIFFGDDFIHKQTNEKNLNVVKLVSGSINHQTSTTVQQLGIYQTTKLQDERVEWEKFMIAWENSKIG